MTFAVVQDFDVNDPSLGITGFTPDDLPTISEISYEVEGLGVRKGNHKSRHRLTCFQKYDKEPLHSIS
jgi:hypothetical protein